MLVEALEDATAGTVAVALEGAAVGTLCAVTGSLGRRVDVV